MESGRSEIDSGPTKASLLCSVVPVPALLCVSQAQGPRCGPGARGLGAEWGCTRTCLTGGQADGGCLMLLFSAFRASATAAGAPALCPNLQPAAPTPT